MPKKRKLISSDSTVIGLVEVYLESDGEIQKVYIRNDSNRTNFLSITKNMLVDGVRVPLSRLDVGEKYLTFFMYEKGQSIYERRFNRIDKTLYLKERVVSNKNGEIFLIDYNGQKMISFSINKISDNDRIK